MIIGVAAAGSKGGMDYTYTVMEPLQALKRPPPTPRPTMLSHAKSGKGST